MLKLLKITLNYKKAICHFHLKFKKYNVQLVTIAHNSDTVLSFRVCCRSHLFFLLIVERFLFLGEIF